MDETREFIKDLTSAICECWLRPFWSITRLGDLERFNKETGLNIHPYALAAYGCMLSMAYEYGAQVSVEAIFDHVEQVTSKLAAASQYSIADSYYGKFLENVALIPLPKTQTFRTLRPLQAADFIIWEIRKNHLQLDEWFVIPEKPIDQQLRCDHFDAWSRASFGVERPPARKSLEAVMQAGAPANGIVWDYDNIMQAHRRRGGVWSVGMREGKTLC
jgi:hypothetical protein